MKHFITKREIVCVLIALTVAFVGSSVQAAEKKNISGTKVTKRLISRCTVNPGDDPRHVITQVVREDTITSSDQDWNDVEAVSYEQADHIAGSGSHKGYIVIRHKGGDESYVIYHGTDKLASGEGGAWEVSSEGEIQFIGGTGKYKDMKGSGKYKGKTTAKGSLVNWEATLEY